MPQQLQQTRLSMMFMQATITIYIIPLENYLENMGNVTNHPALLPDAGPLTLPGEHADIRVNMLAGWHRDRLNAEVLPCDARGWN